MMEREIRDDIICLSMQLLKSIFDVIIHIVVEKLNLLVGYLNDGKRN